MDGRTTPASGARAEPVSVCVLGALHRDLVVRAPRFPRAGETLLGDGFDTFVGGKGANQAVAAARLGARVALLGALGDDEWGRGLRAELAAEGLDLAGVATRTDAHTGVAVITVVPGGENTIVVAGGVGRGLGAREVEGAAGALAAADVLLTQGELPLAATARALELARAAGTRTLHNAAPAAVLTREFLGLVDVLLVNRGEAAALLGRADDEPRALLAGLARLGPRALALTLGAEGALCLEGKEILHVPAFRVRAVDATGAGDAFAGALAVECARGAPLAEAVRVACAAGALATTRRGALPSMPRRAEVEALLAEPQGGTRADGSVH